MKNLFVVITFVAILCSACGEGIHESQITNELARQSLGSPTGEAVFQGVTLQMTAEEIKKGMKGYPLQFEEPGYTVNYLVKSANGLEGIWGVDLEDGKAINIWMEYEGDPTKARNLFDSFKTYMTEQLGSPEVSEKDFMSWSGMNGHASQNAILQITDEKLVHVGFDNY